MCNGPLNSLIDSFSTFQFLRTYNRLITPSDLSQYYNVALIKGSCVDNPVFSLPPSSAPVDLILSNASAPVLSVTQSAHPSAYEDPVVGIGGIQRNISLAAQNSSDKILRTPPCHILSDMNSFKNSNGCTIFTENSRSMSSASAAHTAAVASVASVAATTALSNASSVDSFQSMLGRRHRGEKRPIPDDQKDERYFERRKRNNEAAKKSRDARKLREDRIAFRAAVLEQENAILRTQTIALREEVTTLRQMLCSRGNT